jgi:glycine/D-amino acid oxidase-like deaminating enzyme
VTAGPAVAVIGGGIVGTSAATFLARDGAQVTLYERDEIAAGASGRNSGVVQQPVDPVLAALHRESLVLYRALARDAGDAFHLPGSPSGLLYVAWDEDAVSRLASDLRTSHPDLEPSFLPAGEARRLEPALAGGVAACRLAIGYPVAPAAATHAYAALARDAGARIVLGAGATPWLDGDRVRGVRSGDRTIPADALVVTAGPWSPEVVDPGGRWTPIVASWGVVLDVALPDPPRHVLEELDVEAVIERRETGEAGDSGVAFSLVPGHGSSSLGSTFLAARPDPSAVVELLRRRGARFVPALSSVPAGASRVCARPVSLDGRPLVGALPWLPGAYVAAGHGPWGISTGPASGRLIADIVLGRVTAPPAALDPARFGRPG